MPSVPEYYIVGSEVGTGSVEMLDGAPIDVIGVRFVIKPMDQDENDDVLTFVGVMGKEDVEVLVSRLIEAAESVRSVQEQVESNEKEGNDNNQPV